MSTSRKNPRETAKRHRTRVAAFGAALGTLAIGQAAPAEATVIDLTPLVSSNLNPFVGIGGAVVGLGSAGSFLQWNDVIGKTLDNNGGGITGFVSARASSILTSDHYWDPYFQISAGAAGTRTFGFRTDTGQLGWIRMNLGGGGGNIHYLAAAFNDTPGGPIHVGSVPEPATTALLGLSLLAMGARGVRRLREQRKPASTDAAAS